MSAPPGGLPVSSEISTPGKKLSSGEIEQNRIKAHHAEMMANQNEKSVAKKIKELREDNNRLKELRIQKEKRELDVSNTDKKIRNAKKRIGDILGDFICQLISQLDIEKTIDTLIKNGISHPVELLSIGLGNESEKTFSSLCASPDAQYIDWFNIYGYVKINGLSLIISDKTHPFYGNKVSMSVEEYRLYTNNYKYSIFVKLYADKVYEETKCVVQ